MNWKFLILMLLTIAANAQSYSLFRSEDGGKSWMELTQFFKTNRINVLFSETNRLVAGTDHGLFFSADNGGDWIESGSLGNVQGIVPSGKTLIVGAKKGIWRFVDGKWERPRVGLQTDLIRAVAAIGQKVFAETDSGRVFESADSGETWSSISVGLPERCQIFELKADSMGNLYAALYSNGGWVRREGVWKRLGNVPAYSIYPGAKGVMLTGENPGGINRSEDGGQSWSHIESELPFDAPSWMFFEAGARIYYGTTGRSGLFVSEDRGKNWAAVAEEIFGNRAVVAMTSSGPALFVATVDSGKLLESIGVLK